MGHRMDVCPDPSNKLCRGCGISNPTEDHGMHPEVWPVREGQPPDRGQGLQGPLQDALTMSAGDAGNGAERRKNTTPGEGTRQERSCSWTPP
ncbi:hypothetical protein MTO96_043677 [Rhipicephalus appendiculatus]